MLKCGISTVNWASHWMWMDSRQESAAITALFPLSASVCVTPHVFLSTATQMQLGGTTLEVYEQKYMQRRLC